MECQPTLSRARDIFKQTWTRNHSLLLPISTTIPSDLLTCSAIFLKLTSGAADDYSFLLESVTGSTETIGRYSYIGTG